MPDIDLKTIQPNRLNPRLEFNKAGLDELADSIRQVGILEPLVVRPIGENKFEVVIGERRYRAAYQAGLDKVPVVIQNRSDDEVMEINLIENIQREDLSAVEKGKMCKQLMADYPQKYPSRDAIAKRLGVIPQSISEWIITTRTPEEVQMLIAPRDESGKIPKGKISYDVALNLQRSSLNPSKQTEIARHLAEKPTPSRSYRQIIKKVALQPEKSINQVFHEVIDEAPVYLPFSKIHADAVVDGKKTQTTRKSKDPRLLKGATIRAQVTHFADLKIEDVYRKRLGEFDDQDARREGGYSIDEFKDVWKELHGEWNPNESVYVIRFQLSDVVGENTDSG